MELESDQANHVVVIPSPNKSLSSVDHHPLAEISSSPGHLLLLKLLHREEAGHGCKVAKLEDHATSLRRDAFSLSCLFLAFHFLSLILLFSSSVDPLHGNHKCGKWWVPSSASLMTSLVLVCCVQIRVVGYWRVERALGKERTEGRTLARRILELRMKGGSYDLWKDTAGPATGLAAVGMVKRMKSSSVEVKWMAPFKWCSRNFVTICLLCFSGLMFPVCKFIICP
ncbi:hypothetical protein LUZ63_002246 [Rhynchospora breviuscula]|uniref:Transmembrane protein n=1 Tax=Rhynchospora breviuscula TaxID=2022672 RepID=A0A9Q0CYC9_9POAL|nr:hypothetical protein LUZ63_002246 [Rhynchospora breviuscula]